MDENIFSVLMNEMLSDDECNEKKSSQLLELYFNQTEEGQKIINEMCIILCGHKLETLLEK